MTNTTRPGAHRLGWIGIGTRTADARIAHRPAVPAGGYRI